MKRKHPQYAPYYLRKRVYERDGGQCQYCGTEIAMAECNIDHVIPRRHRGTTRPINLVVACRSCNKLKEGQLIPEELRPRRGDQFPTRTQRKQGVKTREGEQASVRAKERIDMIRLAKASGIDIDDLFSEAEQERWT